MSSVGLLQYRQWSSIVVIPDTELVSMLRICDIIGGKLESREFDSETMETSDSSSCRSNEVP